MKKEVRVVLHLVLVLLLFFSVVSHSVVARDFIIEDAGSGNDHFIVKGNGDGRVAFNSTVSSETVRIGGDVQVDGAGENIGAATLANGYLLVGSTLAFDPNEMFFGADSTIGTIGVFDLNIATNGAVRAIFTDDGKFGLNQTVPAYTLDVTGNSRITDSLNIGTTLTVGQTITAATDETINGLDINNGAITTDNQPINAGTATVTAGHIIPTSASTYDLGSATAEYNSLYLDDDGSVYFGTGQDVRLYRSGANALATDNDALNLGTGALTAGATSVASLNVNNGGITNAGAISGATTIDGSGDLTVGTITMTGFSVDGSGNTAVNALTVGGGQGSTGATLDTNGNIDIDGNLRIRSTGALLLDSGNVTVLNTLTANGDFNPSIDASLDLGNASLRWANAYVSGNLYDAATDNFFENTGNGADKTVSGINSDGAIQYVDIAGLDISADTNLAVSAPITRTDDTIGLDRQGDVIAGAGITVTNGADTLPGDDSLDVTVQHGDTSSVADVTNAGFLVIQNATFDTYGHVLTTQSVDLGTAFDNYSSWGLYVNGTKQKDVTRLSDAGFDEGNDIDLTYDGSRDVLVSVEDDIDASVIRASSASGLQLLDDAGDAGIVILDGGNVGINTTSPTHALTVVGDVNISSNRFMAGIGAKATGDFSTALGASTTASGQSSTALGFGTLASGDVSTALGLSSVASGQGSTVFGEWSTASEESSIAGGFYANASGYRSIALGSYVTVSNSDAIVIGRGIDENTPLVNNIGESLIVGFDSTTPSLFVNQTVVMANGTGGLCIGSDCRTSWPSSGIGDIIGPASATDNAITRFDGTTGKLVQDSSVTIDDSGNIVTSGTVDGRDVSVDAGYLVNLNSTIGLSALTSAEVDQLENIGVNTISGTQWGYISSMDQDISTFATPKFPTVYTNTIEPEIEGTPLTLSTPDSASTPTGDIIIQAGDSSSPGDEGGDIVLRPGTGNSLNGLVFIETNVNISGQITTGQGFTSLYMMDQNVRTSDTPTFSGLVTTNNVSAYSLNSTRICIGSDCRTSWPAGGTGGFGDVIGPASATDNAITRYDGTTGKLVQDSSVTIDDSGNIATSGTVDGRDVSVDAGYLVNLNSTIGLSALTSAEVDQLENIDVNTISGTQWGYVSGMNQDIATTSAPTFATLNTGLGANELYAMNQNVRTSDAPSFAGLTITENAVFQKNVYVLGNVSNTNVQALNVNGSVLPPVGLSNTFSLGNTSQLWKDAYVQGNLYDDSGSFFENTCVGDNVIQSVGSDGSVTCYTVADTSSSNELQNLFQTISTPSGTSPVADGQTDTLNLAVSGGISITGDSSTDTITFGITETGDISAVVAGTGLTGGNATGSATLSIDPTYTQRRVSGTCAAGSSISTINEDGTVSCEADDSSSVSANGNAGYIAMFNGTSSVNNSAIYQNNGYVGINTTSPTNALTVVGDVNISSNRFMAGIGAKATGTASTALGWVATASGTASTALGSDTTASGTFSTAIGSSTTASGDISTAIGRYTTASGDLSLVAGLYANATGLTSFVFGKGVDNENRLINNIPESLMVGFNSTTPSLFVNKTVVMANGTGGLCIGSDCRTSWPSSGIGDVIGPASATDNAITRYDGTTGKLVQDSSVTIDDSGNIATSGTVDGRDVSVDAGYLVNLNSTIGLSALTSAEVDQLENIGVNTISGTQWGYISSMDQDISTFATPKFPTVYTNTIEPEIEGTPLTLSTPDSASSSTGDIIIQAGDSSSPADEGGDIVLRPGTGNSLNGLVFIETNVNISGQITTGQGFTSLYMMDQNVRTSDTPTFSGLVTTNNVSAYSLNSTRICIGSDCRTSWPSVSSTYYSQGEKIVNVTSSWSTVLTVDMGADHRSAHMTIYFGGQNWNGHSAPSLKTEMVVKDGAGGYGEPGKIYSTQYWDPSSDDYVEVRLQHAGGNTINVQMQTNPASGGYSGGQSYTDYQVLTYEINGAYSSVS